MHKRGRFLSSLVILLVCVVRPAMGQEAEEPPKPEAVKIFQDSGILLVTSEDGSFRWWLDGRMMLAAAFYNGSVNRLSSGAEVRRARIGFRMVFWKAWAAKFEVDFADSQTIVKDMWLAYVFPTSMVKVGQYTEPFCLDELMSSRYISFTERSALDYFTPSRHLGISYARWGDRWQAMGGLFGQGVGDIDRSGDNQGFGVTGRVTFTPVRAKKNIIHLGVAATRRTPNAAVLPVFADRTDVRIAVRPETHVNRGYFLDTGRISNVDHSLLLGLEAAAGVGSISVQAEYVADRVARFGGLPSPTFGGWYAFVSWFPTGDHRPYDPVNAEFVRVIPKSRRGAVELVARYSTISLNDAAAGIQAGSEKITTFGVNWYANPNVRLMAHYLFVSNDGYATGDRNYIPNDRFGILQALLQLQF